MVSSSTTNYEAQLKSLLNETSVVRIEDNKNPKVVFEKTDLDPELHQFILNSKAPFDFSALEQHWENKWSSFGNNWNNERQLFRYLWYETRAFLQSYLLYKENFNAALNLNWKDEKSKVEKIKLELRAELAIRSMYEFGKQAIDLLTPISELNGNIKEKKTQNGIFLSQFKETRNKFLTHYHDPRKKYEDLKFDPIFSSLMGTSKLFEIRIHLSGLEEDRFRAEINHYSDYFKLEKIYKEIVESF